MARIRGTNAFDILSGTSGNDSISGYGGDDQIYAGSGNDFIYGGYGADLISGGSGIDTAAYDDSSAGVTVTLGYGEIGYGGSAAGDRLYYIENVIGSNYDDRLIGDSGSNVLTGGNGDDVLDGGGGADTLWGDSGNDRLYGGAGADVLNGGLGNDTAYYSRSSAGVFISLYNDIADGGDAEGDDLNGIENVAGSNFHDDLWGDDGANILDGRDGNDTLKGFGGAETLNGGNGDDSLYGMDGIDLLYGGWGNDMLSGGAGDDILDGQMGDDSMVGGTGNDSYYVHSASDVIIEAAGEGTDTVYSWAYSYVLADNVENLSLHPYVGWSVYGTGNDLANIIYGNAGSNTLNGGGGADQINGLGGEDTFVFYAGEANGDILFEFQGNGLGSGDVIYFVGYGTAAQGASFVQLDATHWQINSADGTIHDVISLAGAPTVDASDFSFY